MFPHPQEAARVSALIVDRELGSSMAALKMLVTTSYLGSGNLDGFYKLAKTLRSTCAPAPPPEAWD